MLLHSFNIELYLIHLKIEISAKHTKLLILLGPFSTVINDVIVFI